MATAFNRVLNRLDNLGVRVTLDKFGGQLTSLADLQTMPLHQLKIDHQLFADAGNAPSGATLRLIMSVSDFLRLETVGEGVRKAEHADGARAAGITLAQGPFFAPALTDVEFMAWLRTDRAPGTSEPALTDHHA